MSRSEDIERLAVLHPEAGRDGPVGDGVTDEVDPREQLGMPPDRPARAEIRQCHDVRKRGVREGIGRSVRHRPRDVADRVVDDIVHFVRRSRVGGLV